jgi:hypothetical protein
MPRYEVAGYDPPAPVAQVTLRVEGGRATVDDVMLLIDTGADVTLLPRAAVERLGVKPLEEGYEVVGFNGSRSRMEAAELEMVFLRKVYRGRYLLSEEDRGVLGRDVLGSIVLLLNGPGQEWSEP